MKTLHKLPSALLTRDSDRTVPPGGGLMVAVAISFAFWGALAWWVL